MKTPVTAPAKLGHPVLKKERLKPVCPLCKSGVSRVRRGVIDRLRGLFVRRGHALYRYHCTSSACAWAGSLSRSVAGRNLYGASGSRRHVLDAARMSGFAD